MCFESTTSNFFPYTCYSPVEMMILLYVIGYAKTIWKMIRANGVKLFFNDIWNGYDFINMLLFILSFAIWGIGFEVVVRSRYDIPFDFELLRKCPGLVFDRGTPLIGCLLIG